MAIKSDNVLSLIPKIHVYYEQLQLNDQKAMEILMKSLGGDSTLSLNDFETLLQPTKWIKRTSEDLSQYLTHYDLILSNLSNITTNTHCDCVIQQLKSKEIKLFDVNCQNVRIQISKNITSCIYLND